jgi:acetoin utilization protein AcuC
VLLSTRPPARAAAITSPHGGIVPDVPTSRADGPLLVFGPRSLDYDFGPGHPLTPRRFGPGIDLLRSVGAEPSIAPEPATDEALEALHSPAYVDMVKRFSADPDRPPAMGIGISDNPAFPGMHAAGAAVADGSLRAMEAILRGDAEHALHPGGGLHHAMAAKAWGFCIYNDPALAIARARAAGLRVLYVDLDTHHGDGVEALFAADPGVLTLSFHESGFYLFPGTGFVDDLGEGAGVGSAVNVPLEPYTGEAAWLAAVRALVPSLAATFGPDVIVSQHGADTHAWDPLAHLRVTTTAMGSAARLVDEVAHRWAGGRWLATGGGGYDAYRVVPRAWSLTWLAGAHREAPASTPDAWRERWEAEAGSFGTPGMPSTFEDAPNAGQPVLDAQAAAELSSLATLARARTVVLPRLVREAEDRGWWSADAPPARADASDAPVAPGVSPTVVSLSAERLAGLALAPRTIGPFEPAAASSILGEAARHGARIVGAVAGPALVGVAVAAPGGELLAVGVAPDVRRQGVGTALLRSLVQGADGGEMTAAVGVAERDWVEPLDGELRRDIAARLLVAAGFELGRTPPDLARDDPWAITARLAPR